ncbi:MAG: hypothetical protein NT047_00785 [Deltaproteobacteria bacterium]|nr:hypothetical protein [Deltaproteobacteria bacterium]
MDHFRKDRWRTHFFEQKASHYLCAIVYIPPAGDENPNAVIGLLVHEAVHVWQHICEELNENEPSVEFEAYSIQLLSQRLIAAYSELNEKMKKTAKKSSPKKAGKASHAG